MAKRLWGIDRDAWDVALEFKPEDLWIGVFWRTEREGWTRAGRPAVHRQWWICILPMLPIHLSWVAFA